MSIHSLIMLHLKVVRFNKAHGENHCTNTKRIPRLSSFHRHAGGFGASEIDLRPLRLSLFWFHLLHNCHLFLSYFIELSIQVERRLSLFLPTRFIGFSVILLISHFRLLFVNPQLIRFKSFPCFFHFHSCFLLHLSYSQSVYLTNISTH